MKRFIVLISVLLISSFVMAEAVKSLPELTYPRNVLTDGERIYITNYPWVYIYSSRDYKLIKKVGGEGQGPGEVYIDREDINDKERGLVIDLTKDILLVNSYGWLASFTLDGKFIKNIKSEKRVMGNGFKAIGNNYVGWFTGRGRDGGVYYFAAVFNAGLDMIRPFYQYKFWLASPKADYDFFERQGMIYDTYGKNVFASNCGMKRFAIHVFDENGKHVRTISTDCEKIKITEDQIKKYRSEFKYRFQRGLEHNLKATTFPEYYPPVRHFTVDDGKVYVMTFKKEGDKTEFLVFDIEGKLLKKVMYPLKMQSEKDFFPYTIYKEKIYQLIENEDENWNLHLDTFQ
jgi:hypothetical protein